MEDIFSRSRLAQKRILITGGTSGIGLATAQLLASYEAEVMLIGRDQRKLDEAVETIMAENKAAKVDGISADLSKAADIKRIFNRLDNKWGGLDILINNASLGYGSVMDGEYTDWEYIVKTNLLGYMACCHEAAKRMQENSFGHIINLGSMSADTKGEQSSVYVATKSGLQGFNESLRKELNPKGIQVTLIEPGAVATDMQTLSEKEQKRRINALSMLHSKDVAHGIIYCLCQPQRCGIVSLQLKPLKQYI